MKSIITALINSILCTVGLCYNVNVFAQGTEIIYVNRFHFPSDSAHAFAARFYEPDGTGKYSVKEISLKDTSVLLECTYLSADKESRDGLYKSYYPSGAIKEKGMYMNGKKQGKWTYWRDNGQVWYKAEYLENNLDGKLTSFYPTGQLKREETFKKGFSQGGNCLDTSGKAIKFTPFFAEPHTERDFLSFLSEHFRYPERARENGIQGKVLTLLAISKSGTVEDMFIMSSPHPDLSAETLRILNLIPKWKAGTWDGEAVDWDFLQPLSFDLN